MELPECGDRSHLDITKCGSSACSQKRDIEKEIVKTNLLISQKQTDWPYREYIEFFNPFFTYFSHLPFPIILSNKVTHVQTLF